MNKQCVGVFAILLLHSVLGLELELELVSSLAEPCGSLLISVLSFGCNSTLHKFTKEKRRSYGGLHIYSLYDLTANAIRGWMAKEWLNVMVSGTPVAFPAFFTHLKSVLSKMLVNLSIGLLVFFRTKGIFVAYM